MKPTKVSDVKVVRTPLEIQRAHDVLEAILAGKIDGVRFERGLPEACAQAVRDCLCWLLGHEGGSAFEGNIKRYEESIKDAGYTASIPS